MARITTNRVQGEIFDSQENENRLQCPSPGDGSRDILIAMPTCTTCGGRGGSYDSQGNWIKCQTCGGSGQTNF